MIHLSTLESFIYLIKTNHILWEMEINIFINIFNCDELIILKKWFIL